MKVAVIDDDADHREMIRQCLLTDGYEVVEAQDGLIGLEIIKEEAPDLIICDVIMPGMNGDELFGILQQPKLDLGCIPFIFLAGNVSEQEIITRLNRGATNCFAKPVSLALLSAHIKAQLIGVRRSSAFFVERLDAISSALPKVIERDFESYGELRSNVNGYVDAIVALVRQSANANETFDKASGIVSEGSEGSSSNAEASLPIHEMSRLNYVDFCLNEYEKRKELIRTANGEDLSWMLIFLVAKNQIEGKKTPISDLYLSVRSAKSTINARINSLIESGILIKADDAEDGRRQLMSLSDNFSKVLFTHLDANVHRIQQMPPQLAADQ